MKYSSIGIFIVYLFFYHLTFSQEYIPGREIICPLDPISNDFKIEKQSLNSGEGNALLSLHTANIIVTYNGFTPEAQQAFQYAVDIWASLIQSDVPIYVNATWASLAPNVLGSAGATKFYRNFNNQPIPQVYYPVALAEKLAGADLNNPGDADISTTFNRSFTDWYFGTDGNSGGKYDFVTIVLHELGHGLGFAATGISFDESESQWDLAGYPAMYTPFIEDGDGQNILSVPNNSLELSNYLQSDNLYIGSNGVETANSGSPAKVYCPTSFNAGSSISHWDDATFNNTENALMTHALSRGESLHDPGPLTLTLLEDIGWIISPTPVDDDITISNGTLSVNTILPGESLTVSCDHIYSGPTLDSDLNNPEVGYFLSANSTFDNNDVFLGDDLSSLGSNDPIESENETITIPIDTDPDDYYILFVGDYSDVVDEIHELNNSQAIPITVEPFYLNLDPISQNIPADSLLTYIFVDSNLDNYAVVENESWLTANTFTTQIVFQLEENLALQDRTANIVVSGFGVSDIQATITQSAGDPFLSVFPFSRNVTYEKGNTSFTIDTNLPIINLNTGDSWLKVTQNENTIQVEYDENMLLTDRTGIITVSGNGVPDVELNLIQEAGLPFLTITPANRNVSYQNGSTAFNVQTNLDNIIINTNDNWIDISKSDTQIMVDYVENTDVIARTATISVNGDGINEQTLSINQEAAPAYLTVSPISFNVSKENGQQNFTIDTNLPSFDIDVNVNWIQYTSNANAVTITYETNETIYTRQAIISVTGNGVADVNITVDQEAGDPFLTILPLLRNVTYENGSVNFSVDTNLPDLDINSIDNWLDPVQNGNTIQVNYEENMLLTDRTGIITVSGNGVPDVELNLIQEAGLPFLTITPANRNVSYQNGSTTFNVQTNLDNIIVNTNDNWIDISEPDTQIMVDYVENTDVIARTATISVNGDGINEQTLSISQEAAPAYLTVSPTSFNVSKVNGQQNFTVDTNLPSFDIDVNVNWIQYNVNGNTISFSYETNETIYTRQAIISVTGNGVSDNIINVIQEAGDPYLVVNPLTASISFQSEVVSFSVQTNLPNVSVYESEDWLSIQNSSTYTIEILCEENEFIDSRTGNILVTGDEVEDIELSISQEEAQPYIEINPISSIVGSNAGSTDVNIFTNLPSVDIISHANWLEPVLNENELTIKYLENAEIDSRTTSIVISGEGVSDQYFEMTQEGAPPSLVLSESNFELNNQKQILTLSIDTNLPEINLENLGDWITYSLDDNILSITIEENKTLDERSGNLVIKGNGIQDVIIEIRQEKGDPFLFVESVRIDLPKDSGSHTLNIVTNIPDLDFNYDEEWLEIIPEDQTITINHAVNNTFEERRSEVLIKSALIETTLIVINQSPSIPYLTVDSNEFLVDSDVKSLSIMVNTNLPDYEIENNADWIEAIKSANSIELIIADNLNFTERVATLNLGHLLIDDFTISITQRQATITASENNLTAEFKIYPNPAKDNIWVELADNYVNRDVDFVLQNLNGKEVLIKNNLFLSKNKLQIDATDLNKGVYLLSIVNSAKELLFKSKLVIQ